MAKTKECQLDTDMPDPERPVTAVVPSMDEIVEEHFDYVYKYAYRYLGSATVSEDLTQETFLAAVESIARYRGKSSVRTWLISILRHKIMDRIRSTDREVVADCQDLLEKSVSGLFDNVEHWLPETGPVSWAARPDSKLNQKELGASLQECLAKLPSNARQIFLLREMDGLGRDDISSSLGLNSSNVGVILHRARLALQHCLQINWYSDLSTKGKQ